MEEKLILVLEYFLSLHEADEIYDAIFNDKIDGDKITEMLDGYREEFLKDA